MAASTRTSPSFVDEEALQRYADVVVGLGANVQEGQIVEVRGDLGKRELVYAIARSAYRRGAKFVDVVWMDQELRRIRIEEARRALVAPGCAPLESTPPPAGFAFAESAILRRVAM